MIIDIQYNNNDNNNIHLIIYNLNWIYTTTKLQNEDYKEEVWQIDRNFLKF